MEKIYFGYSLKNSPIPNTTEYKKILVLQTEKFLKRLRWRVFFALQMQQENGFSSSSSEKSEDLCNNKETYGYKSENVAPPIEELRAFEKAVLELISKVQFSDYCSEFQNSMKSDLEKMKNMETVIVASDKTKNFYKMSKESYDKLLLENITNEYEKTTNHIVENNDKRSAELARKICLEDRMETYSMNEAYITLKDHKQQFPSRVSCRLINPAKGDIGRVACKILQNINAEIRRKTKLEQWRSTGDALEWYKNIPNKSKSKFMVFDIEKFYPSISKELLKRAINFAQTITFICQQDIDIILHACQSILFSKTAPWKKRNSSDCFDITMGSYSGAEVAETVGLYILHKITPLFGNGNTGLYRDDGLAIMRGSGPECDKKRKELIKLFKYEGLNITVESNITRTNFLDVTLDLVTEQYQPFRKPNDTPCYVHVDSNHPPQVIKQLPKMIEKRLSDLSSNETTFRNVAPVYEKALKDSGYKNCNLTYTNNKNLAKKRQRSRRVTWYNPPYCLNVRTNIAGAFLNIVDKFFPKRNPLSKVINRSTVKVSYCGTKNMAARLNKHNRRILENKQGNEASGCNCQKSQKNNCPLNGECLAGPIVYKAIIGSNESEKKIYYGLAGNTFKQRFYGHKSSMTHRSKSDATELSKQYWNLKSKGQSPVIEWSIAARTHKYKSGATFCDVCTTEKMLIAYGDQNLMLNRRTEIFSKCRHRAKYKLKNR